MSCFWGKRRIHVDEEDFLEVNRKEVQLVAGTIGRKLKILQARRFWGKKFQWPNFWGKTKIHVRAEEFVGCNQKEGQSCWRNWLKTEDFAGSYSWLLIGEKEEAMRRKERGRKLCLNEEKLQWLIRPFIWLRWFLSNQRKGPKPFPFLTVFEYKNGPQFGTRKDWSHVLRHSSIMQGTKTWRSNLSLEDFGCLTAFTFGIFN